MGALLSAAGLFALVFAIIEAPQHGWLDPVTLAGFGLGALLMVAFVIFELTRREPMLDPRLFARRGFGIGSLSLTLQFFAQFGFLFVALQYLQFVLGIRRSRRASPCCRWRDADGDLAPRAEARPRLGVRVVGGIGLALMGAGFLVFATLGTDSSYWHFGIGALITGIGIALATAPATTAIVSSLPAERQGIASAVNDLTREVGGAFGIAVLGSVLNSVYRDDVASATARLPVPAASAAQDSIAAASAIAHRAGTRGTELFERSQDAFVSDAASRSLRGALVVSSGDPHRMVTEASFAALAGTTPVDASSGKQQRHCLNRGGDRQLNWALHVIALQRIHHDTPRPQPTTSAYSPPENHSRSTPLRQTSPRPPLLPSTLPTTHTRLDNIEASVFRANRMD